MGDSAGIVRAIVENKWSFYVEAKQYSDDAPKATLVRGMHLVWDTLRQQRGTPHEVREAFFIVFRLGGPRVALPEEVRSEGSTVYPVLIDIGDSKAMGSRQRTKAIAISEAELLPAADVPSHRSMATPSVREASTTKTARKR